MKPSLCCISSVQFSSFTQSCLTLCDRMNCSTPSLPIEEGNGTPLQYACLENPMGGGARKVAVHGVAEGRIQLSNFTFTFMHWRGKGNPLQCSCLENPRYGGAWWAAMYGVAQSRTQLKQLSSSSRPPCPSPTPGVHPDPRPLHQ